MARQFDRFTIAELNSMIIQLETVLHPTLSQRRVLNEMKAVLGRRKALSERK
jgi:hypothetical protein